MRREVVLLAAAFLLAARASEACEGTGPGTYAPRDDVSFARYLPPPAIERVELVGGPGRCMGEPTFVISVDWPDDSGLATPRGYVVDLVGGTTDVFRLPRRALESSGESVLIPLEDYDGGPFDVTLTVSAVTRGGRVGQPSAPFRVRSPGTPTWRLARASRWAGGGLAVFLAGLLTYRVLRRRVIRGKLHGVVDRLPSST